MRERRPRSLWLDVFAVNQLVGTAIARTLAQDEAAREFAVYSAILGRGGTTPTELASFLGLPLTTASDRLNRIVDRGHATRTVNPADGRSFVFALNDAGRELTMSHFDAFRTFAESVLGRLEADPEELKRGLQALEDALCSYLEELDATPDP